MKQTKLNILIAWFVFYCFMFPQTKNSFYDAFNSISSDEIKKHLFVLGDDSLEGRGVGTRGCDIAANYISKQFEAYGLKKISSEKSYFQNIPMHGSIPLPKSELTIISEADTLSLNYSQDYFLYRSGQ